MIKEIVHGIKKNMKFRLSNLYILFLHLLLVIVIKHYNFKLLNLRTLEIFILFTRIYKFITK